LIIEKTKLNEAEAKLHFFQIASAIKYLHFKKICHRDLKPENVLLCWSDKSLPIAKITDIGMSKLLYKTRLKTFCGTAQYPYFTNPKCVFSDPICDKSKANF
jgi:serine/threonine protein kinase